MIYDIFIEMDGLNEEDGPLAELRPTRRAFSLDSSVPPERDRRRFGCSGRNLSVIPCQASQAGRLGEAGDLSSIPTGLLSVAAGVAAGLLRASL